MPMVDALGSLGLPPFPQSPMPVVIELRQILCSLQVPSAPVDSAIDLLCCCWWATCAVVGVDLLILPVFVLLVAS
jgi:hypothetical protein